MDTECSQTSLTSLLERISRLEQDVEELRQCLQGQPAPIARPETVPASHPIMPDMSRLRVPVIGDWEITCLGSFHLRCNGREIPAFKIGSSTCSSG